MTVRENWVNEGVCKGPGNQGLTEAMQSKSESLGWWFVGEPKGQQRKQNSHHIC